MFTARGLHLKLGNPETRTQTRIRVWAGNLHILNRPGLANDCFEYFWAGSGLADYLFKIFRVGLGFKNLCLSNPDFLVFNLFTLLCIEWSSYLKFLTYRFTPFCYSLKYVKKVLMYLQFYILLFFKIIIDIIK